MKILVVDDEQEKRRRISAAILSVDGVEREEIEHANDVTAAKKAIRTTRYDLIILDINLPYRPEEIVSVGAGLDVLHFIKYNNQAKPPAYLFGLTAHDDGADIAAREFSSPLWKLVRFSHGENDWEEPLREAILYLQKLAKPPFVTDGNSFHTDLAIFVALEGVELKSILALDGSWIQINVPHDHARYYQGSFIGPNGSVSVVATVAPRMGMSAAAVAASKLISNFRPRVVAVAGICAGVREKTEPGDILIADPCFDWGAGKWVRDIESGSLYFHPAAYQWRLDEPLRMAARSIADAASVMSQIHDSFSGPKPRFLPKVLIDAMASGASVLQAAAVMGGGTRTA